MGNSSRERRSTSTPRTIVLIGAMGSGKSHIARDLARLSGLPSRDVDALIVAHAGQNIADIFAQFGEAYFRELEGEILEQTLQSGGIIATGGGVVTQPKNRELLRAAAVPVVYLRAKPATLAERIRLQPGTRPLIDGDGTLDFDKTLARVAGILQQRATLYESCATHIIDTDHRTPRDVAHDIWCALSSR
jgi:shikimate kinase